MSRQKLSCSAFKSSVVIMTLYVLIQLSLIALLAHVSVVCAVLMAVVQVAVVVTVVALQGGETRGARGARGARGVVTHLLSHIKGGKTPEVARRESCDEIISFPAMSPPPGGWTGPDPPTDWHVVNLQDVM